MSDILDLIDGAIAYDGDDSMRWSPPSSVDERRAEMNERLLQAVASFRSTMTAFGDEFAAGLKRAVAGMQGLRISLSVFDEVATANRERAARLASMRSAYRRRRR